MKRKWKKDNDEAKVRGKKYYREGLKKQNKLWLIAKVLLREERLNLLKVEMKKGKVFLIEEWLILLKLIVKKTLKKKNILVIKYDLF